MKIKILDASGPPGLPNLLATSSEMTLVTAISALNFSPDGEVRFIDCQSTVSCWFVNQYLTFKHN